MDPEEVDRVEAVYRRSSAPIVFRSAAEVQHLFEGFDLVRPGLVDVTRWRARGEPLGIRLLSGVGVRP